MKLSAREYKLLIEHAPFANSTAAVAAVWADVVAAARGIPHVRVEGALAPTAPRGVCFLDTPDHTLRRNGLVLRERTDDGGSREYTLKCRSEDRYFAAGTAVAPDGAKEKFEEDIGTPFNCRFSHSATLERDKRPATAGAAAKVFPLLGTLTADGRSLHSDVEFSVVNGIEVVERVWEGGPVRFECPGEKDEKAEVGVIAWFRASGAPVVAELSFRVKDKEENYGPRVARAARALFERLQRADCARLDGRTKTEFVYGDRSGD